jgi:membrane protein implicated in regulation of membrane protease activity
VSFLSSFVTWANVPFTIALGVALAFALLQMTGLLGLLAGGGEHDADHEVDADADGDADADHDADADQDHDGDDGDDGDDDGDHAHPGVGQQLLAGLGVGKVPLSIIWQTYAVSFAFAGLAANGVYVSRTGALPPHTLAWTVPGALLFGYLVTRSLGRVVGRMVADPLQEATTRKQLVGHTGVVISSKVSGEFGEVRIKDKTGHVVRIICRTRQEERAIPEGREVVIVDYDPAADQLFVAPLDHVDHLDHLDHDEEPPPRGRHLAP